MAADYEKTLAKYGEEIKRYDGDKKEIKDKAEGIAKTKLKAQEMSGNFAYALIFLQIAIMLSSLASLTKRHYLWYIALGCNLGLAVLLSGCLAAFSLEAYKLHHHFSFLLLQPLFHRFQICRQCGIPRYLYGDIHNQQVFQNPRDMGFLEEPKLHP